MTQATVWQEILAETRELVARSARGAGRTIELSPELAARLQAFVPTPVIEQTDLFAVESAPAPAAPALSAAAQADFDALRGIVAACERCGLCKTRKKTVFGVGDETADWMIVGEAPGAEEDIQGEPFVGRSGQLLDAMLGAMGLGRSEGPADRQVFIANVIKCRPPANRNPSPDEVARCEPYLRQQVALVKPKLLLAMGRFAAQSLLQTTDPIGRLRGQVHHYQGIPVVVTYHPSYLLRPYNQNAKREAWEDLKKVLHYVYD